MTTFADHMVAVVRKYRAILRKHLPQAERINRLHQLNLKNPQLYSNEFMLYEVGYKIIDHLRELNSTKNGYYSYSGIGQFANHLEKFLDKYKVEKGTSKVVHTSQLASRYLVKLAHLLSEEAQSATSTQEIERCNKMIALYASKEQIDLYIATLQNMVRKQTDDRNVLYKNTLQQFMRCLEDKKVAAA